MNQMDNTSTCERAGDLISVLYGEASEGETRAFELHMKDCGSCRAEFASFAQVRQSIGDWRDEALTGFVPSPVAAHRKSAVAALRQFFDLSPLWMKAAVGFAAVVFCVLAVLAFARVRPVAVPVRSKAVYTEQDVNRIVKEALAQQERVEPKPTAIVQSPPAKTSNRVKSPRGSKEGRPFSKAEREQLAADLRLLSTGDDLDLNLLDDRINR